MCGYPWEEFFQEISFFPLISSSDGYLLRICFMPGIVLGFWNAEMSRDNLCPPEPWNLVWKLVMRSLLGTHKTLPTWECSQIFWGSCLFQHRVPYSPDLLAVGHVLWTAILLVWHGHCPLELSIAVGTYRRPAQESAWPRGLTAEGTWGSIALQRFIDS